MKLRIIENFLPDSEFKKVVEKINQPSFGWHWNQCVAYNEPDKDSNFYFTHTLYDWGAPQCNLFSDIFSSVEGCLHEKADISIKAIVRVKCNLYTRTEKILQHDMHKDYDYSHTACLLSLNTCDGYTAFESGEKIDSIANRMLIFDGLDQHCSTTCTDKKARLNVNFNLL